MYVKDSQLCLGCWRTGWCDSACMRTDIVLATLQIIDTPLGHSPWKPQIRLNNQIYLHSVLLIFLQPFRKLNNTCVHFQSEHVNRKLWRTDCLVFVHSHILLQLLEHHSFIIEQFCRQPNVRMLLCAPFTEAYTRLGVIRKLLDNVAMILKASDVNSTNDKNQAALTLMELVDVELLKHPTLQHGFHPDSSSVEMLFLRLELSRLCQQNWFPTPSQDVGDGDCELDISLRLQEKTCQVLARVVDIPLSLGEAAALVRCWSHVFRAQRSNADKKWVAFMFRESYTISCSLLADIPASQLVTKPIATNAAALASGAFSSEQSAMQYLEALHMAGKSDLSVWSCPSPVAQVGFNQSYCMSCLGLLTPVLTATKLHSYISYW